MLNIKTDLYGETKFEDVSLYDTFLMHGYLYIKIPLKCICADCYDDCVELCGKEHNELIPYNCIRLHDMEFFELDNTAIVEVVDCDVSIKKRCK